MDGSCSLVSRDAMASEENGTTSIRSMSSSVQGRLIGFSPLLIGTSTKQQETSVLNSSTVLYTTFFAMQPKIWYDLP
jgi:hypothetical protein